MTRPLGPPVRRPRVTVVAVISDTHLPRGTRRLPDACLRRLREADIILHAGDFVREHVLAELQEYGRVEAVHGNVDEPALRAALPERLVVDVGGPKIGLVHVAGAGRGRDARLSAAFPGCAAVVYGHTHAPYVERIGATWILNPGSPTERRRAPFHSMLVLRIDGGILVPELVRLE